LVVVVGLEAGVNRFVSRSFFEQLREASASMDSMQRLRSWVSRLYSLLLGVLSDPQLRASAERFVQRVCREVSMQVLKADVIPERFPLRVDELVQKMFTAVHKVVSDPENLKELAEQGLAEPTADGIKSYSMKLTYEVLGTCFETALMRIGVSV
jgi:hypothetical protein